MVVLSDRKGGIMTIKQLEKQAELFWRILLDSGLSGGHCKMYDPLTIEETPSGGFAFHSYVFDHEDRGRHRHFDTLEQGQVWLLKSFAEWLSDDAIENLLYEGDEVDEERRDESKES